MLAITLCMPCMASEKLTFGVVPQQSAQKLAATWGPLLSRLGKDAGVELIFKTAKDIPTFEQNLSAGQYDLAYMNPQHYVEFSNSPGYHAILRQKDKMITGIIVVHANSSITTLAELHNQLVAFPAPASFAASLVPLANLKSEGIDVQTRYVFSHDSVYLNVAKGFAKAGGGIMRTFDSAPVHIKDKLRIIWTSKGYTPHAIAIHPRVDHKLSSKVSAAFINSQQDTELQSVLKALNFKGFEQALDSDWNDVRALNISESVNRGN